MILVSAAGRCSRSAAVHAAARGTAPDFSAPRSPAYAGDGFDMCYVKDCARAAAIRPRVQPGYLP